MNGAEKRKKEKRKKGKKREREEEKIPVPQTLSITRHKLSLVEACSAPALMCIEFGSNLIHVYLY